MLSFMREQGGQTQDHRHKTTDTKPESGDKTQGTSDRSLRRTPNGEAMSDEEYLTVAAKNKNVRKTTYLLAVLFGCGLLFLWFMIKKSTPLSAVADSQGGTEQEQIEMAIAQLTGVRLEMTGQMDEVVKKFYQFSDVQQVNVDELVKDPFGPETRDSMLDTGYSTRIENQESRHEMQLLGIMRTQKGYCCMIDDRILYEGDSIRGFKVLQIGDGTVLLQSPDREIVLKLSE